MTGLSVVFSAGVSVGLSIGFSAGFSAGVFTVFVARNRREIALSF